MALTNEDVLAIAKLARLQIEDDKVEQYKQELTQILDLVEEMNQIDVTDVEPMAHPQELMQPLRTDQVTESDQRDKFQAIAPATQDGLYLVPKVIE
jgi:aspartyl-tRNA(Asn)/glutamyl-tRNA(Gln) amidotransferase subunit C